MKLSNKWFDTQTQPIWKKHLLPLRGTVKTYLEIGVCEAVSMRWVIENLKPKTCIGIDPWLSPRPRHQPQSAFDTYRENAYENLRPWLGPLTLEQFGHIQHTAASVEIYQQSSQSFFLNDDETTLQASMMLRADEIDLAYIDGSHWGWDALSDMIHVWPYLKRGTGVMIVDDIHRRWHRGMACVKPAVEAFRLAFDGRWGVLYEEPRQVAFARLK
jgi:hypothetical protein